MNVQRKTKKKIYKTIVSSLVAVTMIPSISPLRVLGEENIIPDEIVQESVENLRGHLPDYHQSNIIKILEMEDSDLSDNLKKGLLHHLYGENILAKEKYDLILNYTDLPAEYVESIQALNDLLIAGDTTVEDSPLLHENPIQNSVSQSSEKEVAELDGENNKSEENKIDEDLLENDSKNTPHIKSEATEMYEAVLNAPNASMAWKKAQDFKKNHSTDSRVEEAINDAAHRIYNMGKTNHKMNNFSTAIYYYEFLLEEDLINEGLQQLLNVAYSQALDFFTYMSAEDMYKAVINAPTASQSWVTVQSYIKYYPNDKSLELAVNDAAHRILAMGKTNHKKLNFSLALHYYKYLLAEPLISNNIREQVEIYYLQASDGLLLQTETDMLETVLKANTASQAWKLANDFKNYYPKSSLLSEAFLSAGKRIYNMGVTSHKARDFDKALYYYDLLLNEINISSDIMREVQFFKEQAKNKSTIITENDLLQVTIEAKNATTAWSNAQKFKEIYPKSKKLDAAFISAGHRIYNMGISSHKSKNYNLAVTYYKLIINEPLIRESLRSEIGVYYEQASNKEILKTADDMFSEVINAPTASEAWSRALKYKELFPTHKNLEDAFTSAGKRILSMGITAHKNTNFSTALNYYRQILDESLTSANITNSAQMLYNLAKQNKKLQSASGYYSSTKNASTASEAWNVAKIGIQIYPNNAHTLKALNEAANRNLKLGRTYHRNENTSQAKIYYDKINQEPKVSESISTLTRVFLNQLDTNHKPIIYLDAGHGGYDSGANHSGVQEKDLALKTTNYLKNELESRGYAVLMSRDVDVFVGLTERAINANSNVADMFISVHYNSMGGSGTGRGIETFLYHKVSSGFGQETDRSNFLTDEPRIDESLRLADSIHSNLIGGTSMYNRGVKGNNFNVLRNTHIPAVLLELGFMDNTSELAKIRTSNYQKKAAKSIADGVDKYFIEF